MGVSAIIVEDSRKIVQKSSFTIGVIYLKSEAGAVEQGLPKP